LQACLQSFCFTLPHSRSECTCARFFVSVFIRVISGFILFFPVIRCDLLVRSELAPSDFGGHRHALQVRARCLVDLFFDLIELAKTRKIHCIKHYY
jgi:hypothetical protein